MGTGRENGTANLLPNGDVLLTGGLTRDPSITFYALTERYTPATPPGPVPLVDALPLLQRVGSALTLTGSGFTGGSGVSTSCNCSAQAGAITTLVPASYTGTIFTSPVLAAMPAGLYMARVIVDGVPSAGRLIRFTDPVGTPSGIPGDAQVAVSWTPPCRHGRQPPDGCVVAANPGGEVTATAPYHELHSRWIGQRHALHVHSAGTAPQWLGAFSHHPCSGHANGRRGGLTVAVPGLTPAGAALTTLMAAAMTLVGTQAPLQRPAVLSRCGLRR